MADKTDAKRLLDLKAALKKAKRKDYLLSLADCAALWGVTKPRFVNKRAEIADFPDVKLIEGNAHYYSAVDAIEAMIAHLERHAEAGGTRARRLSAMIGTDQMAEHIAGGFSMADLARANQLAAEIEARERDQGLYLPIAHVQRVVGMVFSELSELVSNLSNRIDPHGKLAPSVRALIDSHGHEQLLAMHKSLKGMLSPDVVDKPTRTAPRKPRPARAQRKRTSRGPRKAR
jgi:hypothetical protein